MKHSLLSLTTAGALLLSLVVLPAHSLAANSSGHGGFMGWFGAKTAAAEEDTNRSPSISGITSPTVLAVDETGTWTVNASDPENGSLSYAVNWGESTTSSAARVAADDFVQEATFTHAYSAPGTYRAQFTVRDEGGRTVSASVKVLVQESDAAEMQITDVAARIIGKTGASITWDTNLRSGSTVYYGTGTPLDLSTASKAHGTWFTREHRVNLKSLTPGETYYYVVESKGYGGESAQSEEHSFTVPGASNGAPNIQSFTGPATLTADTEGTWTVNASDPENGSLSYAVDWGDAGMLRNFLNFISLKNEFVQESTFTHTYTNAGEYTIKVTVKDDQGKTASATTTVVVTEDEDPSPLAPVISAISALLDADGVTFNWTTDVDADASVYYSASSPVSPGEAGTDVVTSTTVGTDHRVSVDGLSPGTLYHFLLQSTDADGDVGTATQFSLTTMLK